MFFTSESLKVPGFLANGIHVGIKAEGRKDLSLIFSTVPAKAVGMFTTNSFKAAPVLIDMEKIKSGMAQAILTNSGNANAATGDMGYEDALAMSRAASDSLGIRDDLILIASTGIIGQRLPIHRIVEGMSRLTGGLSQEGIVAAEEAIMTTDRFPKIAIRRAMIGNREITICGLAKGAGMISPTMATMLAYFITDIDIEIGAMRTIFRQTVGKTFNSLTVDGCMSTNDSVIMLANGMANNKILKRDAKDLPLFRELLCQTMSELAEAIARDGEGATKVIDVYISGASSTTTAKKTAYAVANSNLVKTAFFGGDPNWGRIISAIGSTGIKIALDSVRIDFEDVPVFAHGTGVTGCEKRLAEVMALPYIRLKVDLASGNKKFRILTSDLGFDYIKINAHYHT